MEDIKLLTNNQLQKLCMLFTPVLSGDISSYAQNLTKLSLPTIEPHILISLCKTVTSIFSQESVVLSIDSPVFVVGDIHGHILDLFRIFKEFGLPSERKFLFLGDLVDRGEFSVETIIFLFILKALYPLNTLIIRGNHEFEYMASQFGFVQQLSDVYGTESLAEYFYDAFSQIPLAASIFSTDFAVHGGIGPSLFAISQISSFKRPLLEYSDENATCLLWSDPSDEIEYFTPSSRGTGFFFGKEAMHEFLFENKISLLIRGHECVTNGIDYRFNCQLVTVFSASNYCGIAGNKCGVLEITGPFERKEHYFPPLPYLLRKMVFNVKQSSRCKIESYESAKKLPKINQSDFVHSLPKQISKPAFRDDPLRPIPRQQTTPLLSPTSKHFSIRLPDDQLLDTARHSLKLPTLNAAMSVKERRRSIV